MLRIYLSDRVGQAGLVNMVNALVPSKTSRIRVREIADPDMERVKDLLVRGFPRHGRDFWDKFLLRLAKHPTPATLPKFGYLLESGGVAVGVIILIFSRLPHGAIRCNVSSWFVEPSFRSYASFLAAKALSHKDVTYLNLTPAPHTRPIARAQGYSQYTAGTFVAVPALNFSSHHAPATLFDLSYDEGIDPYERNLLFEHADYGCISLVVHTLDGLHPFVFRPRVVKGVPGFAQLIYCRNIEDFVRFSGSIGRFLIRRGKPLVIVEANGSIPGLVGKYFAGKMPHFFRGADRPHLGDLAYTELAMFDL
jgi:hypothetical protein